MTPWQQIRHEHVMNPIGSDYEYVIFQCETCHKTFRDDCSEGGYDLDGMTQQEIEEELEERG